MEIWLKCSTDKTGLIYLKPQLMVTFVACFKSQSGLGVSCDPIRACQWHLKSLGLTYILFIVCNKL